MRSKASLNGHPIHPMLIPFPIAFLTGVVIFDSLQWAYGSETYRTVAYYLEAAGILGGMAAAVPGLIDLFYTIPPHSSAMKRGIRHALLNGCMLFLFIVAFILRQSDKVSLSVLLGLEGAGFLLMLAAGWLGGTLTSRNQIGTDHRYAGAGKWKEERITAPSGTVELKGVDKLGVNQIKLLHINGKRIAVARTENGFTAFGDRCTHKGGPLSDAAMICKTVQCPWHGSQFDTETGAVKAGPAKEKIKTYAIRNEGGKTILDLRQDAGSNQSTKNANAEYRTSNVE